MTETKLDYQIQPRPNPFLTGQTGTLEIVISDFQDETVRVKSIFVSLSEGGGPNDLSGDLSKVKASAISGWKVTGSDGSYALTPDGGFLDMDGGALVLVLPKIKINNISGGTEILILEETEVDGKSVRAVKRKTITKVSPDVAIDYFDVKPASFKPGDPVLLKWKGTAGATYVISYANHVIDKVKGQDTALPNEGSYSIEDLDEDTTFTLTVTGGPKPITQQAVASIERAKVVTFTVDNPNPMYGQPVRLDWEAVAGGVEIVHDGKSLKASTCTTIGTLKGHVMVTSDKPDAIYTLTATAGETTDQKTAQVAVQVPEVSIEVDETALTYGKNPKVTWGFKNRWTSGAELEAVGARTKKSYFKTTLKADDGKDASRVSTDISPFDHLDDKSTKFDLGVGEGVILTAKAPWFAREAPVVATKTLTYTGVQNLDPGVDYPSQTSYAGGISESAQAIKSNPIFVKDGIVTQQLEALALGIGVATDKVIGAECWTVPFIVHGEGIKSVSLRIDAIGGDSDWKKLWFDGTNSDPIGGNPVQVYPWYNSNKTKYRGQISLFSPKAMLDAALLALHFTVIGEGMHVSWYGAGNRFLKVNVL